MLGADSRSPLFTWMRDCLLEAGNADIRRAAINRSTWSVKPLVLISWLSLHACASYAPDQSMIGRSRDDIISRLGSPDPEASAPAEEDRLDFPRGPMGKETYFVYFDKNGNAVRFLQALTEDRFALIHEGMSSEEVVRLIGRSRNTFGLARERGFVWSYRYQSPFCQWFQIEFSKEGVVRSTGFGKPPECRGRRSLVPGF